VTNGSYTDLAGNAGSGGSVNESENTVTAVAPVITAVTANGKNWNLSGSASPNASVAIFNGTTQIATATANGSGSWSVSKAASTSTVDTFTAVASTLTSAAWIEGTSGANVFSFSSEAALAAPAHIIGNGGADTIAMTTPLSLVDSDFAHVTGVQKLQLTGASSVTVGANAVAAGISTVIIGSGATSITDNAGSPLSVDATALVNNTLLTLSGSAAETVTKLTATSRLLVSLTS
jgi:hypothetical protein